MRSAFSAIATVRRYSQGEFLHHNGDEADGIFGLVDGTLDVTIPRADGLQLTIHRAAPGFWFGDIALFGGGGLLDCVVAGSVTQVVHIPHLPLRELVRVHPEFYEEFYALGYANMSIVLRLLANLATTPSAARVAMRLLMYDEKNEGAELSLSQSKLAELVGLSPPTLQRILRRLQAKDVIEVGYGRIRILDQRGLRALCGAIRGRRAQPYSTDSRS